MVRQSDRTSASAPLSSHPDTSATHAFETAPQYAARVVVADDEAPAREALIAILSERTDVQVVAEARDGHTALQVIAETGPDVAFLDLKMPGLGGLEIARQLLSCPHRSAPTPAIIFVTAFDKYAVDAFDLGALDYVLKPLVPARVHTALARAMSHARQIDIQRLSDLIGRIASAQSDGRLVPRYAERFSIASAGRVRFILTRDIEWFQAEDNYVRLHTRKPGEGGLVRATLGGLEVSLDPLQFARVHRSAIIRLESVRELRVMPSGEYEAVLSSGVRVSIGRSFRDELLARLR